MDCAYGSDLSLRRRLTAIKLAYAVGVWARTLVRKAKPGDEKPVTAAELAKSLPKRAWRTIGWRDGSNTRLISRFARVRVRAAGEGTSGEEPEEWLIIEWPKGEKEPTKFWLSTLDEDMDFARMIDIVMMRWRIVPKARFQHDERDYQDLKQEVGLGHFEGRSWRGFHHHATMCIAAYGFLVAEKGAFPPSAPRSRYLVEKPAIPQGYRPRGLPRSGLSATSRTRLLPSVGASTSVSSPSCRAVRAVPGRCTRALDAGTCDAVQLARQRVTQHVTMTTGVARSCWVTGLRP